MLISVKLTGIFAAMSQTKYQETLEAAKSEMAELLRKRKELDSQLSKLAPVIEYLSVLCNPLPPPPPVPEILDFGLSDSIRFAFKGAGPFGLTPTEVRDKLREQNFHLDRYKSELPPIHNTIARLKTAGEVEEIVRADGGRAFVWVSGLKRAIAAIEAPAWKGPGTYVRTDK
jgi:hypothetical protein